MPIVSVTSDLPTLTLTAVGEYPVTVERLWAAWSDPRQLERFWGPPTWPATFTRHDMRVGGRSEYAMTGPKGETSRGYWVFEQVEPPRGFVVRDGFANPDGTPNDAMPGCRMKLSFEPIRSGARFTSVTTFPSVEAMEQMLSMGMVDGLTAALAQMDEVVAELREHARSFETALSVVDDTHVVVSREVRGTIDQVWRAHHEAQLLQRWMLGPDGWTMPVCRVATKVGESYRYEWENGEGARFGFEGELLESEAPWRAVTTEQMIGVPGPGTVNELVLVPRPGGRTLIAIHIRYPSKDLRDTVLATGMVGGMEASYARLESVWA